MSEEIANLVNSALAALSQNATFPPDVEFAKNRLREAQSLLTQRAPDVLARCAKCNALIETTVHCDNCGTFEPTRR